MDRAGQAVEAVAMIEMHIHVHVTIEGTGLADVLRALLTVPRQGMPDAIPAEPEAPRPSVLAEPAPPETPPAPPPAKKRRQLSPAAREVCRQNGIKARAALAAKVAAKRHEREGGGADSAAPSPVETDEITPAGRLFGGVPAAAEGKAAAGMARSESLEMRHARDLLAEGLHINDVLCTVAVGRAERDQLKAEAAALAQSHAARIARAAGVRVAT